MVICRQYRGCFIVSKRLNEFREDNLLAIEHNLLEIIRHTVCTLLYLQVNLDFLRDRNTCESGKHHADLFELIFIGCCLEMLERRRTEYRA